ncbi:hypothetical protein LCGC14_1681770 [marine sediment metagenome]|uniref:Uncharacterized protein n=1 Tax=marine sediment metagenome TaxID=412755 RepID=A0A0F9KND2_9ZZZZ
MINVSRSEIFVRDEKGPAWFDEFLRSLADSKSDATQEILDAINNDTVDGKMQDYREQIGLDALSTTEDDTVKHSNIKEASGLRPLSIRHAEELQSVIEMIEDNPELRLAIDSFCEHSGGTKNTHSIIQFVRNKLGKDVVSYSDEELKEYIEGRKKRFKHNMTDKNLEVGLVGLDSQDIQDDNVADYATHDGAH